MEETSEFKYRAYLTILLISVATLALLALKTQSENISECLRYSGSTTSAEKNHKKGKFKKCLDGKIYDDKKAPIYKGDAYGDSVKQAKEVRKYIRPYLKKKGYEQYMDIVVAICAQESRFGSLDYSNWMQVKGYTGPDGIASTRTGIDHFIQLIQHAKDVKCTDIVTIIQAYNFGNSYLDYCMKRGGKDTDALRSSFQAYQKQKLKTSIYGDINYAEKILGRIKR